MIVSNNSVKNGLLFICNVCALYTLIETIMRFIKVSIKVYKAKRKKKERG